MHFVARVGFRDNVICSNDWLRIASSKTVVTLLGYIFLIKINKKYACHPTPLSWLQEGTVCSECFLYIRKWSCCILGIWSLLNVFGIRLSPGIFYLRHGFIEQRQEGPLQMPLALESVNFWVSVFMLWSQGTEFTACRILLFWDLSCELIGSPASGLLILV